MWSLVRVTAYIAAGFMATVHLRVFFEDKEPDGATPLLIGAAGLCTMPVVFLILIGWGIADGIDGKLWPAPQAPPEQAPSAT